MPKSCVTCGAETSAERPGCVDCQRHYAPALLKALAEPGQYLLGMRSGSRFSFRSARFQEASLTLYNVVDHQRGSLFSLDVMVAQIEWIADCTPA